MNRHSTRLPAPARKSRPLSRLAALLDFVIRHGGIVAVDPVHTLPLDPLRLPRRR